MLAAVTIAASLSAQEVFLVEDLDSSPPPAGPVTSAGSEFVAFQGALYFRGCDALGCELWKTDGTPGGTTQVADLNPGAASGNPGSFSVVGTTLYFTATSAAEGTELWKSDGTGPGTALVKDIRSGASGSSPALLTAVGTTLYFRANDGTNGTELWKSDGSGPGTLLVANLNAGSASSTPNQLAAFGSSVLFVATDGTTGNEPWISDGTGPGTVRLADVRAGTSSGVNTTDGPHFAALGGSAYFVANDGAGWALWESDGTPGGTGELFDFGLNTSFVDKPIATRAIGGQIFVAIVDGTSGSPVAQAALWGSDGTAPGTQQLAAFETALQRGAAIGAPVDFNGIAYFAAATRDLGVELWRSDGTVPGTSLVKDIWPGAASGGPRLFATSIGLLLGAAHPEHGVEAWFSDGSAVGTVLLRDSFPGLANGGATLTTGLPVPGELGGEVYFLAADSTTLTTSVWRSDGTPGGTVEAFVAGAPTASGGRPSELAKLGTRVLFSARDGVNGREPWISDKTPAGTLELGDLAAGIVGSDPRSFAQLGSIALFSAWTPATGRELFVTDGTPGGTALLADIEPGAGSSNPANLVALGGVVLFRACDAAGGCELWKSDGTGGGTQRVKDIVPGSGDSFPEELTAGAGRVFFRATTPGSGTELWVSDGTSVGTIQPVEIAPGAASSLPWDLEGTPSRLFFLADDGSHGVEVWTSDGTPGGTLMPKDVALGLRDGAFASTLDYAAVHQGSFYFALSFASDTGTPQLWKSDGTPAGTVMVRDAADFDPPWGGSGFHWLGSGGDFLWLSLYSDDNNWEPYRTNGTGTGTIFVQELNPGAAQSQPYGYFGFEGNAYFMANGPDGRRLWRGTGHPHETVPLGSAGVVPLLIPPYFQMVEAGGTLFFPGSTTADGQELFAYGLPISVSGFESADFSVWDAVVGAAP